MENLFDILMFVAMVLVLSLAIGAVSAAPFVPTRKRDVRRILDLAEVKPGDRVYDLGCGDGRVVAAAAEMGAAATGFEIAIPPLVMAWVRTGLSPARNRCRIIPRNFWTADLSDADVIFTFLTPPVLARLVGRLEKVRLKPGTRIVNAVWPIPGWQAAAVDKSAGRVTLYLYRIGQTGKKE
jgi:SAM-dependent methyltransferase